MQVSEFIEWLQTQPQDAIVEVVYHKSGCGYYDQGGNARSVGFDPSEGEYGVPRHWSYTDFRGNYWVKESEPHFGKHYLLLGGLDE